jgi:hypothetical protein
MILAWINEAATDEEQGTHAASAITKGEERWKVKSVGGGMLNSERLNGELFRN